MQYTYLLPATVAQFAALPLNAAENRAATGGKLSIVAPAESRTTRLVVPSGCSSKPLKSSTSGNGESANGSQVKWFVPSTEMRGWVEPARAPQLGGKLGRDAEVVETQLPPAIIVASERRAESRGSSKSQLRIASVPQNSSAGPLVPSESIVGRHQPRLATASGPPAAPLPSPVEPEATVVVPRQKLRLAPAPPTKPAPMAETAKVQISEQQPRRQLAVRSQDARSPNVKPEPRLADRKVAVARTVVEPTVTAPDTSELSIISPAIPVERVAPHPMSAERTVEVTRRQMEPMPTLPEPEVPQAVEPMLESAPMPLVSQPSGMSAPRPTMASRTVKPKSVPPMSAVAKPAVPSRSPPPIVYSTPPLPKPAVYRGYTVPGRSPIPFAGRGVPVQRPFYPEQNDPRLARTSDAQLPPNQRANVEATADRRHAQSAIRR